MQYDALTLLTILNRFIFFCLLVSIQFSSVAYLIASLTVLVIFILLSDVRFKVASNKYLLA